MLKAHGRLVSLMTCIFQRYVLGTGAMACKIDRADKLITYTSHIGVCL